MSTDTMSMGPVAGPAVEIAIARHLAKLAAIASPVALLIAGLLWGLNGTASCALGIGIVLVNFAVSAYLISTSARISLGLMMAAVLFGFLIRLALIGLTVWWAKDQSWVEIVPLGITIIVTHLGLLFWEMKFISASLAFPGHKPAKDAR
jgi:ATP synthase I chain